MTGRPVTGTGLALRRVARRSEDTDSPLAAHPALRPYLADLAAARGLALREEVLGTGQAYAELAATLVEAVTSPEEPVDLLVLAYGVPDVQPGRNTALRLAEHCPGRPLAFAVCDQGPAAAFTALRVAAEFAATGACARAVLVVAEQAALPYPLATPAPMPDRHAAVALLLETGPAPVDVRSHPALPPEAVGAVLAAEVAELVGERDGVRLVLGPGVDVGPETGVGPDVLRAAAGQPYTGTWARLAEGEPGAFLVVADYDPVLGYLCVAGFEKSPRPVAHAAVG
ncbi:2-hydroxy-acid oxidase [Actinophytocola xanthii]|uniref:2-hydroxy-acid oxidase n=1 Tax=Actinophytocola xanthii TaxID=1912961 RepID=UPI001177C737|nr:2-hydroxy-acid oxidase [Actinophytocola xanthii]